MFLQVDEPHLLCGGVVSREPGPPRRSRSSSQQLAIRHRAAAVSEDLRRDYATRTCCRVVGEIRSSGVRIPRKFSGSEAETVRGGASEPGSPRRRTARRSVTASGSAYCSPSKPATKRPPRISPRASSSRQARAMSRQTTGIFSRVSVFRKTRVRGGGGERRVGARVRLARENAPPSRAQTSFSALQRRQEEPAQAGKRITRHAAQRDELPQALLDKSRRELRRARQFLEEHRPSPRQRLVNLERRSGGLAKGLPCGQGGPDIQLLARHQADRRSADGARARAPEPAPGHFSGKRELIEPVPLVAAHARR